MSQVIEVDQWDEYIEEDSLSVRTQTGGKGIPSLGIFKVLVLLIDFESDSESSAVWPIGGDPAPGYVFLNGEPYSAGQTWVSNNMSRYTYEMSNGLFQMIGQAYRVTLPNHNDYSTQTAAISAALAVLDPDVDFGEFDNWNNYSHTYGDLENVPDGRIDFSFAVFRQSLKSYWSTITYTGSTSFPSFISNDTVTVDGVSTSVRTGRGCNQGGYITASISFNQCAFMKYHIIYFPVTWLDLTMVV